MDIFLSPAIEKLIFEKYIHELSDSTFKVFLKVIWLSRKTDKVKVRSHRMLKKLLCICNNTELVWNELVHACLIIKKERKTYSTYVLNSKKLKEECGQDFKIKIVIFQKTEFELKNVDSVGDEVIVKMIKTAKIDNILVPQVFKLLMNVKKYHLEKDKEFLLKDVGRILFILVKYDSKVIIETCNRFNTNEKLAGFRGIRYIAKMLEGIDNEIKQIKIINEPCDDKKVEVDSRKQEGEKKFAIKLAIGDVENSIIYKRLLKSNVEQLQTMWQIGIEELKKSNRENEIFYDYDWLKFENKKV
jgi:hypothetical protein